LIPVKQLDRPFVKMPSLAADMDAFDGRRTVEEIHGAPERLSPPVRVAGSLAFRKVDRREFGRGGHAAEVAMHTKVCLGDAFVTIANRAEGLKVFERGLATEIPRCDVIDLKISSPRLTATQAALPVA